MKFKTIASALILVCASAPTTADAVSDNRFERPAAPVTVAQVRPDDVRDRRDDRRDEKRSRRSDDRRDDRRDDWRDDRRADRRDDWRDDRRDERWERYWRYRIGVTLLSLPLRHTRVVIGPTAYYYSDGVYMVKKGGRYIVVRAPVGARVAFLPYGFRSFWIGPRRYFYVNSTYYVYAPASRDYVVVAAPSGADESVQEITPDPVVYPAQGQSQDQVDRDRYECHRWGMDESGFDPTRSQQDSRADEDKYNRALTACLKGRGYTVE